MYVKHDFQPLRLTGIQLSVRVDRAAMSELLVVCESSVGYGLYDNTNVAALVAAIESRCGKGSAMLREGNCDEIIALVAPDREDALEYALILLAKIETGEHLDEDLFWKTLDERVATYWAELPIPKRIEMMRGGGEEISLALHATPPPAAMSELRAFFA